MALWGSSVRTRSSPFFFIPRWCNGSTEVFGTFSWSSNLYRGTSFAAGLKPVVERFFCRIFGKVVLRIATSSREWLLKFFSRFG